MKETRLRRLTHVLGVLIALYLAIAYMAAPEFWKHYEKQPDLAKLPMTTRTSLGIPGDPINVGLVGDEAEIKEVMKAANWQVADALSLRADAEIAGSVVFRHSYLDAPVSSLYYLGRKQDLAFEKEQGADADRRHHVRFWKVLDKGEEGRPVWLGSAAFDEGVGLSHFTGQVTHHISGDVDAERNFLIGDLNKTLRVTALYEISGVGPGLGRRNGGGDYYWTDGEVHIAVIAPGAAVQPAEAVESAPPALTALKDNIWSAVTGATAN